MSAPLSENDASLEEEYRNQKKKPVKQQADDSGGVGDALETVVDVADTVISSAGCLWLAIRLPIRLIGAIWGIFSD